MNDHKVFVVLSRDPYTLAEMGTYRANNGHGAIQACIEYENERISPLGACDFVAYPVWAASRSHYPGFAAERERLASSGDDGLTDSLRRGHKNEEK